jgi:hypothetical protein
MRLHVVSHEKNVQVIVSIANLSKGLEWKVIVQNEDFCDITYSLLSARRATGQNKPSIYGSDSRPMTWMLNKQMLCLKAGEEQINGGQSVTDDTENNGEKRLSPYE